MEQVLEDWGLCEQDELCDIVVFWQGMSMIYVTLCIHSITKRWTDVAIFVSLSLNV